MVILDQDHIEEAEAMIGAAAGHDRCLFQIARNPGVVLRVSRILRADLPAASTNCRVSVAIPHSRCRKLRATRSAVSNRASRRRELRGSFHRP